MPSVQNNLLVLAFLLGPFSGLLYAKIHLSDVNMNN